MNSILEKSIDNNALRGIEDNKYEDIKIELNSKERFKEKLKEKIDNREKTIKGEYFFECKVNWKEILNDNENNIFYCPEFTIDKYTWRIEINPRMKD